MPESERFWMVSASAEEGPRVQVIFVLGGGRGREEEGREREEGEPNSSEQQNGGPKRDLHGERLSGGLHALRDQAQAPALRGDGGAGCQGLEVKHCGGSVLFGKLDINLTSLR